jgi:hypothetical protein
VQVLAVTCQAMGLQVDELRAPLQAPLELGDGVVDVEQQKAPWCRADGPG